MTYLTDGVHLYEKLSWCTNFRPDWRRLAHCPRLSNRKRAGNVPA